MNKLRISGEHYDQLINHLYPGDHKEAVAVALCGRISHNENHILCVHEVLLIPYDACYDRKPDLVHWPTEIINPLLEKAAKYNYALLKIHCHPGGGEFFSDYDNESDQNLFSSIHSWLEVDLPHASCIMLPDKRIFGRFFNANMQPEVIHQISVAGSTILNWYYDQEKSIQNDLQI
ncbi:MAG TPA: Mov34/MPN/PAD-1 family protein, partial [Cyclobacteriaceae bacterium]|nr:Mov34/MPN/PAD-1 family protein [Cyclobacteriaceae bacterium]